ncbi:MAG: hypothetical protein V4594_04725 [Bacteroidota bacterium]
MRDPNEKPAQQQKTKDQVKEPTQQDGTNWEENQRIDEEGNELDPGDIK